jgi:hypothetical protein
MVFRHSGVSFAVLAGAHCLLPAILSVCAFGQATPPSSGPEIASDQPRTTVIGYPYDGRPVPPSDLTSMRDLNQAWRICSYTHRQLTPETADAAAKRYAAAGFTLMISEGNRYLFWDKDRTSPKAYQLASHSQPFEDLLRDTRLMSDACHKHGMRFFLHLTSTMVDASLLKEHPDWAAIDMTTGESRTNSYGTANTCFINQDFMKAFYARLERLIQETHPDGMMLDEIQFFGYSLCGCRWCRDTFKKDTGFELPQPAEWPDWAGTLSPGWKRWKEWRREKAVEESKTYRALFKKCNPEGIISSYLCNPATGYSYAAAGLVVDNLLHYADSVGYECEPQDLLYAYYWPHMVYEMKYQRAVAEDVGCAPWALFYNTSTRPGDYTINWLLAMSQGQRHWWLTEDRKYDRCWAFQVAWEAKHEKLTMNQTSAANIGVLFSRTSRDQASRSYGAEKREWIHGYAGTCNALTFGHVPYKAVIEEDLKAETLTKKLKTLVLFNTTNLSDSALEAVKEFVRTGGILLASGDTSRYDANWQVRPDFGLAEVFGFHHAGECAEESRLVPEGRGAAVLGISEPIPHKYPFNLVKDLAADVTVLASMKTPDGKTYPGLVTRTFGEGQVFYFSGHPELSYFFYYYNTNVLKPGTFWKDERDPAWGQLLCRIVQVENPGIPMVVENLPRGVVAEVYRQEYRELKGIQVLLANFLGGEVAEGIISPPADISFPSVRERQPRPNEPIRVAVRAPGVKKVYLLSPDFDAVVELPFQEEGEMVRVELPVLYRFAMLYFSQGSDAEILKAAGGKTVDVIPPARDLIVDKAGAEEVGRNR